MEEKEMRHMVLDSEETLAKAMSDLEQTKLVVVVTKDGKYHGIIGTGTLKQLSDDPNTVKAGHMSVFAPTITEDTTLIEMCRLFFTTRFKALPLVKGDTVKGIVSFSDLLADLVEGRILEGHIVNDVMSRPGIRVDIDATLAQAQSIMRKNHVRRLIVTREGMLSGLLSTYDMAELLRKPREKVPLMREKISRKTFSINLIMQSKVASITPDKTLTDAAKKMISSDVASLVVIEENKPVGIITMTDILETVFSKDEPNVHISGLYDENKHIYPEVMAIVKREIAKLERTGNVDYLSMHFKFRRKMCLLKVRLKTDRIHNVSASAYGALDAVKETMRYLKVIIMKEKQSRMRG
ncbi:MAG: CBS domain-containing protein [Candidatus Micrarchaeota archaeon]